MIFLISVDTRVFVAMSISKLKQQQYQTIHRLVISAKIETQYNTERIGKWEMDKSMGN